MSSNPFATLSTESSSAVDPAPVSVSIPLEPAREPSAAVEKVTEIPLQDLTGEAHRFEVPIEPVANPRQLRSVLRSRPAPRRVGWWGRRVLSWKRARVRRRRADLAAIEIKRNDLWDSDWEVRVAVSDCLELGPRPLRLKPPRFLIGRWLRNWARFGKRFGAK